jgi:hypothetical protein
VVPTFVKKPAAGGASFRRPYLNIQSPNRNLHNGIRALVHVIPQTTNIDCHAISCGPYPSACSRDSAVASAPLTAPEVADRLEALWHAWETVWPNPGQRIAWFPDGLDHQLAVMTADDGPLRECSAMEDQHFLPRTLAG